jgi:hypothetical protein
LALKAPVRANAEPFREAGTKAPVLLPALKHAVAIFPLFPRRDILEDLPVFGDLPAFDPVEIDIDGRFSFDRALRGDEDEVATSQQDLDLVYASGRASVPGGCIQVAHERLESAVDARLMADAIVRAVLRNLTVISGNVDGLVVFPDD